MKKKAKKAAKKPVKKVAKKPVAKKAPAKKQAAKKGPKQVKASAKSTAVDGVVVVSPPTETVDSVVEKESSMTAVSVDKSLN